MTLSIVPDNRPEANPARPDSGFSHPVYPHGPRVAGHQVYASPPLPSRIRRHGWPCRCVWGHPVPVLPGESRCDDFYDAYTVAFTCDCGWSATDRVYTPDVRRIRKGTICPNVGSVAGELYVAA